MFLLLVYTITPKGETMLKILFNLSSRQNFKLFLFFVIMLIVIIIYLCISKKRRLRRSISKKGNQDGKIS